MNSFTIIIPIYNESDSIFTLLDELLIEFKKEKPEILIINDGSTDNFEQTFDKSFFKNVKKISHKKNLGKCKAMVTGVKNAKNQLICVMDGDGQNPPYEAKQLVEFWGKIRDKKKFSLICGNRKNRADNVIKIISSRIANKVRRSILKDDCNDTACALKVFKKEDFLKINYFRNMHRFLPALFKMHKGVIYNVMVDDRERFAGKSKFNFHNRFWIGIFDLIKVWLLTLKKRSK